MDEEKEKSTTDSIQDLESAIQNLEEFANQNEAEAIPNVQNLDVEGDLIIPKSTSGLDKTIDLIGSIFPTSREKHNEKRLQVQKKLLESIDFLKTHYRTINKFKKGSVEQQEWASWAQKTINRYNTLIAKSKIAPHSLKERVVQFFYKHSGLSLDEEIKKVKIDIPHDFSVHFDSAHKAGKPPTHLPENTSEKIVSFLQHTKMTPHKLTKQEEELFLMKTISLGKSNMPSGLRNTLTSLIREAPIKTTLASPKSHEQSESDSASIISLEQTITAFPGEKITVQGSFKRDARSPVPSVPIPDSFHVSTKSTQTGFPHPSQNTGWSLSNSLIPECPLRLDQLPLFDIIYEKKKKIASALLPEGSLNEKAKLLLKLKTEAFEKQVKTFLDQHQTLSQAIVDSAPCSPMVSDQAKEVLKAYFNFLKDREDAYDLLCQTYQVLNALFIDRPYDHLQSEWLEKHNPEIISRDPKASCQACMHILDNELDKSKEEVIAHIKNASGESERIILEYLLSFGQIIGTASKAIILQQLSEKIGFPPLLLNDFEQKIQSCTYKQLLAFQEELEMDTNAQSDVFVAKMQELLQHQLEREIILFKAESCDAITDRATAITHELEFYYNARYYSRL